jgi:ribosome-associated protein
VSTGGEAKLFVQSGEVRVNGAVELRRGHNVAPPDVVAIGETEYRVCSSPD